MAKIGRLELKPKSVCDDQSKKSPDRTVPSGQNIYIDDFRKMQKLRGGSGRLAFLAERFKEFQVLIAWNVRNYAIEFNGIEVAVAVSLLTLLLHNADWIAAVEVPFHFPPNTLAELVGINGVWSPPTIIP